MKKKIEFPPTMAHHHRRSVSDVTNELKKDLETIVELIDEESSIILEAECECCGLKEECSREYISRIRNSYSGKWVCGLCSEAVKERLLNHGPAHVVSANYNIEEAVTVHTNFVQEFNNTTRINPVLSLAWSMRDIAKRNGEKRNKLSGINKIIRSSSCVARIDV